MESQTVRTLQKKRTTNFREDETKLLIQLWGSPLIQNKLYLTHRKAPVMRLLAANMQQRGFYRTPDEIKTRIRNLKCLYHRIKRTMACGTGLGTVDPDWPHFKAMDAILSKQGLKKDKPLEMLLEGPRCEDIKQEIDIDINDDVESWATNSMGSEYDDDPTPPPLTPAPINENVKKEQPQQKQVQGKATMPTIMPSFTIPASALQNGQNPVGNGTVRPGMPSIPLPLLILNSLQPQQSQEKKEAVSSSSGNSNEKNSANDLSNLLKDLLENQRELLNTEKQRLEVEKQKLEFDRLVGSQLLTLVPMFGSLLQRLAYPANQDILNSTSSTSTTGTKNSRKRQGSDLDILKDSKILRTVLEQGIKKYMMGEDNDEEEKNDSDNEDSGIHNDNDENSSSSEK